MRRFSSYGPVNKKLHYCVPRIALIKKAYTQLMGEHPEEGGHYYTVWAPRQTGKTWTLHQVLHRLQNNDSFDVLKIDLEHLKYENDTGKIISVIAEEIGEGLGKSFSAIDTQKKFQEIFRKDVLEKPLILIFDEFDALPEEAIGAIVSSFRNIYIKRMGEADKNTEKKSYLLHGVALIGVRSVLGIGNQKGSPFNVQRSLHISNLTYEEVREMFKQYEKESGQTVEKEVVDLLFDETRGQPGLTSWFGELLTEGFEFHENNLNAPISIKDFKSVYAAAANVLPNNNILNIISKVKQAPYRETVIKLFQTDENIDFKYDDPELNFLYMNGAIEPVKVSPQEYYVRFSSPFVQKRLFNFFSREIFKDMGALTEPFISLKDVITDTTLNLTHLLGLYQAYLQKNREWLFKKAPRRVDGRLYEAVYHFNLYSYMHSFLKRFGGMVLPEFPTGNGQIDLVVDYAGQTFGIELKSFSNERGYRLALEQAARYAKQLKLPEIVLVFFVPMIDDNSRKTFEKDYKDKATGTTVVPVFIETGN
ncbi:MAG: ATP-binding protein [bacterium]|nr:ATP-binding protein [bacterium]